MLSPHSEQTGHFSRSLAIAIKHLSLHGLRYSAASLWREIWFDIVQGVDTTAPQYPPQSQHSIPYQGADPQIVKQLLAELPARAKASTFVDFGCGKGRVLILALEHGFKEVIGVEIAPELASICKRNLSKVPSAQKQGAVRLVQADASTFAPPPGPVTAFFFNPFHGPPLEKVARNLRENAERHGADVWLIYINPLHLDPFITQGFKVVHSLSHRKNLLAVVGHIEARGRRD